MMFEKFFCRTLLDVLVAVSVVCHAQQCSHRIQTGPNDSGNVTVYKSESEFLTCLDVTPPVNEDKFILLNLPPSVSVLFDQKLYESNDASQHHCFFMTQSKQCSLWYADKLRKTCPGGVSTKPVFGPTTISLKISPQDGSNKTTVEYKQIHRKYDGYFERECIDLESPAIAPTTASTPPDTTTMMTSSVSTEQIQDEFAYTAENSVAISMKSPVSSQSQTTAEISTGARTLDKTMDPAYRILTFVFAVTVSSFIAGCIIFGGYTILKRRNNKMCCRSEDSESGTGEHGVQESRIGLMGSTDRSNISTPTEENRTTESSWNLEEVRRKAEHPEDD